MTGGSIWKVLETPDPFRDIYYTEAHGRVCVLVSFDQGPAGQSLVVVPYNDWEAWKSRIKRANSYQFRKTGSQEEYWRARFRQEMEHAGSLAYTSLKRFPHPADGIGNDIRTVMDWVKENLDDLTVGFWRYD